MRLRLVLFAFILGLATGCERDAPNLARGAPTPKATGPRGLSAGEPALVGAVREVVRTCQVLPTGEIRGCTDEADERLAQQQRVAGPGATLLTACHALGDRETAVRAWAGNTLGQLAYPRALEGVTGGKLLGCLLGALRDPRLERAVVRPVARAAAYLAPRVRREEELVALVRADADPTRRAAVWGALWANGRGRVFERLAATARDPKQGREVRVAVLEGFPAGGPLVPDERRLVCALLLSLLEDPDLGVAAAGARSAIRLCPEGNEQVLRTAEALLVRGKLDPAWASAVRLVEENGADSARRARVLALLVRALADSRLSEECRAAALSKIAWLEPRQALKLAEEHARAEPGPRRSAAEAILARARPEGRAARRSRR